MPSDPTHLTPPSEEAIKLKEEIKREFPSVFQDGVGVIKSYQAHIPLKLDVKPVFTKARIVPMGRAPLIEQELQRLIDEGVLSQVEYSDWASPICSVFEKDSTGKTKLQRVCGDYKGTLNPLIQEQVFPMPRQEVLLAKVANWRYFSKVDVRSAYQTVELDPESRILLTLNTQSHGLLQPNRLLFGLVSSGAIFQQALTYVIGDLEVIVYVDDILIGGKTREEHDETLRKLLARFQEVGLRVKESKCAILVPKVTFLGHVIDSNGIHP
jgi:hypothetical protein